MRDMGLWFVALKKMSACSPFILAGPIPYYPRVPEREKGGSRGSNWAKGTLQK